VEKIEGKEKGGRRKRKKQLRGVLSLFDGISCGRLALERAGISYERYYASEIDRYAVAVTRYNFPDTVFVGDVRNISKKTFRGEEIDLIMGGFPCVDLSVAGKRKGMTAKKKKGVVEITSLKQYLKLKEEGFEFEGESYLFWEMVRLIKELKPKYFLVENVPMNRKWERIITFVLGVMPVRINSALVSAQNRKRLYWTNIPVKGQPEDKGILLKDILEEKVDKKYFLSERNFLSRLEIYQRFGKYLKNERGELFHSSYVFDREKSLCIDACYYKGVTLKEYFVRKKRQLVFEKDGENRVRVRRLTPLECERLQTLPDGYTEYGLFEDGKVRKISDAQRYRMIGNAWTVDVIAWILSFIK